MCVYMYVYMCVHVCVYMCMCICMYMHTCVSVYIYAYTCICTCVWVYICTRVGVFCFFVLSNPSTICACITGVFSTLACVCRRGLEVGFVSACSWLALVAGVRGYILTGVEIGILSYCSVFAGVRVWVGVCLYTRVHTHKLLRYLMWAQA